MKNKTVDSKETFINEMRKLCKKYKIRECACSAILHSDNENRPIVFFAQTDDVVVSLGPVTGLQVRKKGGK